MKNGSFIIRNCWWACVIVGLVHLSNCVKPDATITPKVIGHAGIALSPERAFFPPNTLDSYSYALFAMEADGIEVDVQLSADGSLFCFHDQDMQETTGQEGCLNDLSASEINQLPYYRQYTILPLSQVLELTRENEKILFLDLKHLNACSGNFVDFDAMQLALEEMLEDVSPEERMRIVLSSRSIDLILQLTDLGCRVAFESNELETAETLLENGFIDLMVADFQRMDESDKADFEGTSVPYVIFGVKTKKDLRKLEGLSPEMIISDNIPATKHKYD